MNSTLLTEEQLVLALQSGQQVSFTALYDAYSPVLFGIILRLVKEQELAEDLLQDTFIKIWTHRSEYDPEQGRLFTWLARITRNVALDELRRLKKVQIQSLGDSHQELTAYSEPTLDGRLSTESVLSQVPVRHRQLVDLAYTSQYTHEEIAGQLNLPVGTVKARLRAALRELKLFFKEDISHYRTE